MLGWPLGIGNFQKLKIMLLPPPYLVPIVKNVNCAIFYLNRATLRRPSNTSKFEHSICHDLFDLKVVYFSLS